MSDPSEYIVLLLGDVDGFAAASAEEQAAAFAVHERFGAELTARGHEITGGAELASSASAKRVSAGDAVVTDGPFTETTEQVGGFYLIRTSDVDDLAEVCKILAETGDQVEIRQLVPSEGQ